MNIYVGNLSAETVEDTLSEAFSAFGEVREVRIIRDGSTGASKGFGFVTMEDDAEGEAAIEGMNEKELDGQAIKVEKGRPRADTGRGRGGRGGSGGRPRGGRGGSGGRGRRDGRRGGSGSGRGRGGGGGGRRY